MLRGPVQASFPTLEPFPREAGTSGHVYPFSARSASPAAAQTDLRLPSTIASATFWRSPYSEALRQSKSSSASAKRGDPSQTGGHSTARAPEGREKRGEERGGEDVAKGVTAGKTSGDGDGSDGSSDNVQQIRGILCKSSLSSNSRQSMGKVQKRVKFDDSVDRGSGIGGQSQRHVSSAGAGPGSNRSNPVPHHHRSASASPTSRVPLRMPSLRHSVERLQSVDKAGPTHSPSYSQSPGPGPPTNPHQHPHIPRPHSGPLIRTSSVPELTLPRPTPRSSSQQSYQLMHSPHGPHSQHGASSPGTVSSPSRLSPTTLEFRIYRQPPTGPSPSPRGADSSPAPTPGQTRARYFTTPGYGTGTRALVRLSRSFTSPSFPLQRPLKQPNPSASSAEDQPLPPTVGWTGVGQDIGQKHGAPQDFQVRVDELDGDEKDEDRRGSFLDDDKTVQILHWLKEVDHRQAREGRCPVFVHGSYREG